LGPPPHKEGTRMRQGWNNKPVNGRQFRSNPVIIRSCRIAALCLLRLKIRFHLLKIMAESMITKSFYQVYGIIDFRSLQGASSVLNSPPICQILPCSIPTFLIIFVNKVNINDNKKVEQLPPKKRANRKAK
jgi:hypothetical protein